MDNQMTTDRLLLRGLQLRDLPDFYELVSNPSVLRFEPYSVMSLLQAEAELTERIKSRSFTAAVLKDTLKMIGIVYLGKRDYSAVELGFLFNQHYWGKGYAGESCEALIRDAFLRGTNRVYAECDPDNTASWKLLERLGFEKEGHLRRNVYFKTDELGKPIWKDTFIYSLLNG